jgi:hypothetical protein
MNWRATHSYRETGETTDTFSRNTNTDAAAKWYKEKKMKERSDEMNGEEARRQERRGQEKTGDHRRGEGMQSDERKERRSCARSYELCSRYLRGVRAPASPLRGVST